MKSLTLLALLAWPLPSATAEEKPAGKQVVELLQSGRAAEAEALLRRARGTQPGAPTLRYLLGVSLLYQQRLPEAETELAAAVEARRDRPRWFHTLALARSEQGKCQSALLALDRAVALAPEPRFRFDRALCLLNLGRFAEAEAELRLVIAALPTEARPHLLLARLLRDTGRSEEARAEAEKTLATFPQAVEARVLLGLIAVDENRAGDAADAFRTVLAAVPSHTAATYGLARALGVLGEKVEAAATMARYRGLLIREERLENQRQFLSLSPADVGVRLALARELLDLGRFEEAAGELAVLTRLAPDQAEVKSLLDSVRAHGFEIAPKLLP